MKEAIDVPTNQRRSQIRLCMVYRYPITFEFKKHCNSVQVHHIPCGQSLAMKLFSKCPYTLDTCGTSLHTYSTWNTTAGIIQPCRTTALKPHTPNAWDHRCSQLRTPNPVASTVHMSFRRHLKCHCLDPEQGKGSFWMIFAHGEWRRKNTRSSYCGSNEKSFSLVHLTKSVP